MTSGIRIGCVILLFLLLIVGVASASSEEIIGTQGLCFGGDYPEPGEFPDYCQPGSALRYDPAEDTFSGIRDGVGTDWIQYPYYTIQLLAGTTNDKFTNMSRATLSYSPWTTPRNAIVRGAFLEFNATTYSDMGEFGIGLTPTTITNIGDFDQDYYQIFGNTPLTDNITISSDGLHHVNMTFSEVGLDYITAGVYNASIELTMRLEWDINNSFTGVWVNGGNTTLFVNETHDGRLLPWHDRTYLHIIYDTPPTAAFSCVPTIGSAPLVVSCTDSSLYSPINWSWTSSNGQTSSDQNPTFTYSSIGEYDVSLTVCNNIGCDIESKPAYISIREPVSNIRGIIAYTNMTGYNPLGGDVIMRNSTGALYTAFVDTIDGDEVCVVAWSTDDGYTWNSSNTPCVGSYFMNTMVGPDDKIAMTYYGGGTIYYRNFTLSEGFGDPLSITDQAIEWSSTIDSHGTVYLAYDASSISNYKVEVINVSSTHVLGQPIMLTDDIVPWYPKVMIDKDDNVHVLWGEDGIGVRGEGIMYRNFTYGGEMGNLIQMSDVVDPQYPLDAIVDQYGKFHVLYHNAVFTGIQYINTTLSDNFQLSNPLDIGSSPTFAYPALSFDGQNTLHFLIENQGIIYRNLTSSGFSSPVLIENSPFVGMGNAGISALYNLVVPGNVPDDRIEFVGYVDDVPYYLVFGTYPKPSQPVTPAPTNPFNSVTIESTAQTIQMVITLGIFLSILAIIAMLILKFITPGGE